MDAIWQDLTLGQAKEFTITHKGRSLRILHSIAGLGGLRFLICVDKLGAGDYLPIVNNCT